MSDMQADEEIRLVIVCNCGTGFVVGCGIRVSSEKHSRAETTLQGRPKFSSEGKRQIFFGSTAIARSCIHASMTRVDDNDLHRSLRGWDVGFWRRDLRGSRRGSDL